MYAYVQWFSVVSLSCITLSSYVSGVFPTYKYHPNNQTQGELKTDTAENKVAAKGKGGEEDVDSGKVTMWVSIL